MLPKRTVISIVSSMTNFPANLQSLDRKEMIHFSQLQGCDSLLSGENLSPSVHLPSPSSTSIPQGLGDFLLLVLVRKAVVCKLCGSAHSLLFFFCLYQFWAGLRIYTMQNLKIKLGNAILNGL